MRNCCGWCGLVVLLAVLSSHVDGAAKKMAPAPQEGKVTKLQPGPKSQKEVQTALIKAKPGDTIELGEGTFEFTMGLSLTVKDVTLRGQGMDKTFLSFKKQNAGSEGLLVTSDGFRMENLTVEDAKGDGVKVNGATGVIFRKVRARWSGGPRIENGGYGLYPVQCKHVLIEDCVANDASDAGIYVGQSQYVIVRRCLAERNVAGIEIENTFDADVYENTATNNSGGILVFDLPGLQQKNGGRVRVFHNTVKANNHRNFAPKGNTVADVPPGTGLMVMATDQVEMFQNKVTDNQTVGIGVVSYFITQKPLQDKGYDPYPEGIFLHDNVFANNGTKPQGLLGGLLKSWIGTPLPDILYDGVQNPAKQKNGQLPPPLRLHVKNNGTAQIANFHFPSDGDLGKLLLSKPKIDRELKNYEGELPRLPEVKVKGW